MNKPTLKDITTPGILLGALLIFICILIWLSSFWGGRLCIAPNNPNPVVAFFQTVFAPNTLTTNLVSLGFTIANVFLLALLNSRFTIIRTRTFLPIVFFLLLMATWNETHIMNGSHLALTLFLTANFYILNIYRDKAAVEQAFMGSFLIALGSIIVNACILLIPVFWVALIILQSLSLRTWLASIFGTLAPWVVYLAIYYFLIPVPDYKLLISNNFQLYFSIPSISILQAIYTLSLVAILIICLVGMYTSSSSDSIHTRAKLNYVLLLLISTTIFAHFCDNQFIALLPFVAMTYALMASHSFSLKQNSFWDILFLVFLGLNLAFIVSKYIPY